MTETTATTGASTNPVEAEPADDSVPTGAASGAEEAASSSGEDGPDPAPGEPAAGADPAGPGRPAPASPDPSPTEWTPALSSPTLPPPPPSGFPAGPIPAGPIPARPAFSRPPGMHPPPETPEVAERPRWTDSSPTAAMGVPSSPVLSGPPRGDTSASGSFPVVSASAPVSAPPRATGRATTSGVTIRPIGPGPRPAVGAARVTETMRAARTAATTPRGPRRARLAVKRVDPWSVMKFSFAVSLVLFIVVIVAASVLYLALDSMGVFTSINETVADLVESGGGEGQTFRITARGVIGSAGVLGALNVLLFTSLATLGAFIYNVCADLVGGVEVTLAERD